MYGIPAAAAARATATSPSGWAIPAPAIGAIASGIAHGSPSIVDAARTRATSTSTRGRSVRLRHAATFSPRLTSSHEPPAT